MNRFLKSVRFALKGIRYFLSHDRNGKIELAIGIGAILLGFVLRISGTEWLIVLFCTGLTLSLEMINSAIEKYCDLVTTGFNPVIKIIKDVAAGAVLIAAMTSLVVGLVIYIPAITKFVNNIL